MITENILDAVLLDMQERKDRRDANPLVSRCENYMIEIETVTRVINSAISMNLHYDQGSTGVDINSAAAEAFIMGVICGRMEILSGG